MNPKWKRPFRKGLKKRVRKFKPKRKLALSATNTLSPLPARYIAKMKYSSTFQLTALNNYQYLFNLNSTYDPDRTGVGHQPYSRDSFAALYSRYRVISCSYTISGIQTDSPGTNVRIGALPSNDVILFGNLSALCESPRAKFIVQGAQGAPLKTLHGKVYMPALMGRTKTQYMSDDRYQADAGSNPQEFAILHVMGNTLTDTGAAINAVITLEYTVEWFDILQQSQS